MISGRRPRSGFNARFQTQNFTTNPVGMDSVRKPITGEISVHMLVGYMRVST